MAAHFGDCSGPCCNNSIIEYWTKHCASAAGSEMTTVDLSAWPDLWSGGGFTLTTAQYRIVPGGTWLNFIQTGNYCIAEQTSDSSLSCPEYRGKHSGHLLKLNATPIVELNIHNGTIFLTLADFTTQSKKFANNGSITDPGSATCPALASEGSPGGLGLSVTGTAVDSESYRYWDVGTASCLEFIEGPQDSTRTASSSTTSSLLLPRWSAVRGWTRSYSITITHARGSVTVDGTLTKLACGTLIHECTIDASVNQPPALSNCDGPDSEEVIGYGSALAFDCSDITMRPRLRAVFERSQAGFTTGASYTNCRSCDGAATGQRWTISGISCGWTNL